MLKRVSVPYFAKRVQLKQQIVLKEPTTDMKEDIIMTAIASTQQQATTSTAQQVSPEPT